MTGQGADATLSPAEQARAIFIDGMGGIGEFWGIARAMGQLWAVLYLSPEPMTMDQLVEAVGITKGHASTNLRQLLRLGLVTKSWRPGDRKEYYSPQADLWAFARSVLRERQKQEFDQALASSVSALAVLELRRDRVPAAEYRFLKQRLEAIRDFHGVIDRAVAALLALDDLGNMVFRLTPGARRRRKGGAT
jgi:DNA-binding transcriptional regulator GbsR (MarR family)